MAKIETVGDETHQDEIHQEWSRDFDETSAALMAQIREGHQEYLRGELKPIDEFMTELETELANEQDV